MKEKTIKKTVLYVYEKAGVLIILLLMCLALSIMTDSFLSYRNLMNVIRQVSFWMMIAMGALVVLIGDDFDLSAGSVVGLTSILSAMTIKESLGNSVILPLLVAVAVGFAVGLFNGILVAYIKIPAFIATLGTQILIRGLGLYIANGRPVSDLDKKFVHLGSGNIWGIPIPVIVLVFIGLFTWYMLRYTRLGRHIYAMGGNPQAAIVSGVDIRKLKTITFIYAGITAAIAGVFLTARVASGNASYGDGFELKAIEGCVIGGVSLNGGVGSVYGVVCGILIIGVLNNGMNLMNVSGYMQQIAQGAIIILAVMLDVFRAKTAK